MSEWLTQIDWEEAIYQLKKRLTSRQMRAVINREVEDLVARTEQVKGNYKSRLSDEELAGFLIDIEGVDLLKKPEMRGCLVKSLDEEQINTLATWKGDKPPRTLSDKIRHIVTDLCQNN